MSERTKLKKLLGELIDKKLSFEVKYWSGMGIQGISDFYGAKIINSDISSKKIIWLITKGFKIENGCFVVNFEVKQGGE